MDKYNFIETWQHTVTGAANGCRSAVLCGETHHAMYSQWADLRLAYCKIIGDVYYHATISKLDAGLT
jgi:hypothetical protein